MAKQTINNGESGLSVRNKLNSNFTELYNSVSSISANSLDTGVRALTSNWESTYTTFKNVSSTFLTAESDSQTLSFNETNKNLSISNGNTVSLSALVDGTAIDAGVRALTSTWVGGNEAFTNLVANSAAYLSSVDISFLSVSANWNSVFTTVSSNSAKWEDVYSNVVANSATYATIDFANNKFFTLSGGLISGATRINGNVTIFGDLSSTGTQTFANTIFSTTSALSVVHIGTGPAVWIGNNGSGDIASFYDIDQDVEVLHVGGINSSYPNVGVKVSNPNKDFTVNGEISANNTIYDASGNSTQWNSVYSSVQSNSATNWNYQGTDLKALSANWQNTFTTVQSNSGAWSAIVAYSSLIGNSATNPLTATHNLNTKDIVFSVREVATNKIVYAAGRTVDNNNLELTFSSTPSINQYDLTVLSNGGVTSNASTSGTNAFALVSATTTSYIQVDTYTHHLYNDTTAGGEMTVYLLPPANHVAVTQHKKIGSTANVVLSAPSGATIDGQPTYTLTNQYEAIGLYTDGTNYFIQ